MTNTQPAPKRILYYGPDLAQFDRLLAALRRAPGCAPVEGDPAAFQHEALRCHWVPCLDPARLVTELESGYVNLVALDLRCRPEELEARAQAVVTALGALDQADDIETRFAFHRTLLMVSGRASPALDRLLVRFGALGVGNVVRDVKPPRGGPVEEDELAFAAQLAMETRRILSGRRLGRRALCAAGGGITGIYFELGALKCLDDCLAGDGVNGFELYFGISAGAVVAAPIANGYSVDEYMAAIAGVAGGRMRPLDLRLFRLGHLDGPGLLRRALLATRTTLGGLWSAVTGRSAPSRESLLFDYADLVAPPFRADGFERVLREILTTPGASNDFRRLPRSLFVGATDQDAREHVLFGDERNDAVPISLAIQASMSLNPAFSSTHIRGRWYEDGAVTRTSNFVEAIRRGATLVVVLDPFVPYVARPAGFTSRRGILYNMDQDVRTISYTRYANARSWVLRQHPDVSVYTFVPANRLRRLLSVSPMDHRPYLEIWRGAYLSTWNHLRRLEHRLVGDFAAHGLPFDLARASEVAGRLQTLDAPLFEDFFPDRRVRLKRLPLCLEETSVAAA